MSRPAQSRRSPALYALMVVTALTAIGIGLFVWGPINPNLSVNSSEGQASVTDWIGPLLGYRGSSGSGQSVGPDGRAVTELVITNHSFAAVELETVRVAADDRSPGVLPTIVKTINVPATLSHGADRHVIVTVDARKACVANHGGTVNYQLLVDAKTASGLVRTIGQNGRQSVTCSAESLPSPGPGPADPTAARVAIEKAFTGAYDFSAPADVRHQRIDDSTGLEAAVAEVRSGPYGGIAKSAGIHIVEMVFTSPTRALALYDLTGVPDMFGAGRIGEAHLVDGRWKVTRATVCADLALAQVSCPKD